MQTQFTVVAATFSTPRLAAGVRAGLLIPRSQVRILPGPSGRKLLIARFEYPRAATMDRAVAVLGMAKRQLAVNLVLVASPVADLVRSPACSSDEQQATNGAGRCGWYRSGVTACYSLQGAV